MTQSPKPDGNDHDGYELDPSPEAKSPPSPAHVEKMTTPDSESKSNRDWPSIQVVFGFQGVSYGTQFLIGIGLWFLMLGCFIKIQTWIFGDGTSFGSSMIPGLYSLGLAQFARRYFDWPGILPGMILAALLTCLVLSLVSSVKQAGIH